MLPQECCVIGNAPSSSPLRFYGDRLPPSPEFEVYTHITNQSVYNYQIYNMYLKGSEQSNLANFFFTSSAGREKDKDRVVNL